MAFQHARNTAHRASLTRQLGQSERERGFTLIELLVVTAILVLITGIMLANNREFGGRILLENLAYDVALTVRQAQVYGISVRQFETGTFALSYGVNFNVSSEDNAREYVLFGDLNDSGVLDEDDYVEGEENAPPWFYRIERGYSVEKLCVPAGESAEDCEQVEEVDIVFRRPEPDACISEGGNSPYDGGVCESEESARVVLISPRGDRASVIVELTGQIHVQ